MPFKNFGFWNPCDTYIKAHFFYQHRMDSLVFLHFFQLVMQVFIK